MNSDDIQSIKLLLRGEVLPALRAYGVADAEVAYEVVAGRVGIIGTQFRDALANRVSRFALPVLLLLRMEECLCSFAHMFRLMDGEGVIAIALVRNELGLRHVSGKEGDVYVHDGILL